MAAWRRTTCFRSQIARCGVADCGGWTNHGLPLNTELAGCQEELILMSMLELCKKCISSGDGELISVTRIVFAQT
jgi:hypothetical protein